jgi:hypothetical protein
MTPATGTGRFDRPRTRRTGSAHLLAATLALVSATACASGGSSSPFVEEGQAPRRLEIRVDNIAFNDATLYAVTRSRRQRLGIVQAKSNGRFVIEWPTLQDIQIEIDLLASQSFLSDVLSVAPGEYLEIQVQEPVNTTVISRRNRR